MSAVKSKVESQQQLVQRQAIEALEKLGGQLFKEEDYQQHGNTLVIPTNMTLGESWRYLRALEAAYEETVNFSREYRYKPWDVALNAYVALKEHFGSTRVTGTMGFFGMTPPSMIDVPVSPTETVQVPWGEFTTPFLPDVTFHFGATVDPEYGQVGVIYATGPKKRSAAVQGVFELIQRQLEKTSIYKGKAFTAEEKPRFVALDLDPEKIVYAAETKADLEANVFGPIRHRELLESLGQSSKRAVLVHGPFGTGKTLTIGLTAQEAVAAGWTAIVVRPGRDDITAAFRTARMYGPAVICVEDVDTIADASREVDEISHILELFDGVEAKHQKVMVVLTTNHIEKLHKGMIRPGRLDAIIKIGAPDEAGVRKLIEVNLPEGKLSDEINWEVVGGAMTGFLPSFVVETATRALRYAVVRELDEGGKTVEDVQLTTEDLVFSALSMREHLALMEDAKTGVEKPTIEQAIASVVRPLAEEAAHQAVDRVSAVGYATGRPDKQ